MFYVEFIFNYIFGQLKLVQVVQGEVLDFVVDLRNKSFLKHLANMKLFY